MSLYPLQKRKILRYLVSKILLAAVIFIFPMQVFAQNNLPDVGKGDFLLDPDNIFNKSQQNYLVNKLQTVAKESGSMIVVGALLKMPEDSYLDDYANRLFEKWKPGSKEDNNGILILFFKNDRKIKIEVGYGVEHLVTDLQAGRVIDDVIIPEFKNGDYFAGISNGIDVLASAVKGEYTIPVETKSKSKRTNWITLFIIFFVIVSIFRRFGGRGTTVSRKGSRYSRTAWGVPFFIGGGGGSSSFGGGGGFSGGFGGLSGGGGASGSW